MAQHSDQLKQALHYHQTNEWARAERLYREILVGDKTCADAWNLLGLLCHQQGLNDQAVTHIQQAIQLAPTTPRYLVNLGVALRAVGQLSEAVATYEMALALGLDDAGTWYNLANTYNEQQEYQLAVSAYQKAIQRNPEFAEAHNNLGDAWQSLTEWQLAIDSYRRAIQCQPHFPAAWFNLAKALQHRQMTIEAIDCYQQALAQRPNYLEACINLGYAHEDLRQFTEASVYFGKAIEIEPESAEAHFNLALLKLRTESFTQGWQEYEWRWQRKTRPASACYNDWHGQQLASDQTLFIYAEQGLGDEIMFASCLPDVMARAKKVILECDHRLAPILERSFPELTVISKNSASPVSEQCNCQQVALASLPQYFRREMSDFPKSDGYLTADVARVEKWSQRLASLGSRLQVGISWRGGADPLTQQKRSLDFADWEPFFSIPGIDVINLQYGPTADECATARNRWQRELVSWYEIDPLAELEEFAALLSTLDLVISVDNSTVHLAGALGTPTWVLLPYAADWRWFSQQTSSPWYSSLRLFSQSAPGNWQQVVGQIVDGLHQLLQRGPENPVSSINSRTGYFNRLNLHIPEFAQPALSSPYGFKHERCNVSRQGGSDNAADR